MRGRARGTARVILGHALGHEHARRHPAEGWLEEGGAGTRNPVLYPLSYGGDGAPYCGGATPSE